MGRPKRNPTAMGRAEHRVIRPFATYPRLTVEQATIAAGYPMTSIKHVAESLHWLTVQQPYLVRRRVPDDGSSDVPTNKSYWSLREKGRSFLSQLGHQMLPKVAHDPQRSALYLKHDLAINDVLIGCERFARTFPGHVHIHSLTHDLYLARRPFTIDLGQGKTTNLHADGDVTMTAFDSDYNLWLELDRGTEHQDKWKAKVEAIVRHAETLGQEPITIMVVTTGGAERRNTLWEWTGEKLEAMGRRSWADLFRITTNEPDVIPEREFFVAPRWVRPFDPELYPLLDAPQEAWE